MSSHHSHNLLIVSDLHIGQGYDPVSQKLDRHEDFIRDREFAHFLVYHELKRRSATTGSKEDRPWRLVINGDVVDFLQVTAVPARDYGELR